MTSGFNHYRPSPNRPPFIDSAFTFPQIQSFITPLLPSVSAYSTVRREMNCPLLSRIVSDPIVHIALALRMSGVLVWGSICIDADAYAAVSLSDITP